MGRHNKSNKGKNEGQKRREGWNNTALREVEIKIFVGGGEGGGEYISFQTDMYVVEPWNNEILIYLPMMSPPT
jgi:hypothetical protein